MPTTVNYTPPRPRYWYEPDPNGYTESMPDLTDPNSYPGGPVDVGNDWNPAAPDPTRGYSANPGNAPVTVTDANFNKPPVDPAKTDTGTKPPPSTTIGPAPTGTPTNGFPDLKFNFTAPTGPTGAEAVGAVALPQFAPPTYKPPPAFAAPSMQDALNDPGYQFRLQQGEQALQQSAAGRGLLNSGGTLKDIMNYGQNAASQEYENVYNRALNQYGVNYGTQYTDPYKFAYQSAYDQFQPSMTQYNAETAAASTQPNVDWQHAYDLATSNYNADRNNENDKFNRYYSVSALGAGAAR